MRPARCSTAPKDVAQRNLAAASRQSLPQLDAPLCCWARRAAGLAAFEQVRYCAAPLRIQRALRCHRLAVRPQGHHRMPMLLQQVSQGRRRAMFGSVAAPRFLRLHHRSMRKLLQSGCRYQMVDRPSFSLRVVLGCRRFRWRPHRCHCRHQSRRHCQQLQLPQVTAVYGQCECDCSVVKPALTGRVPWLVP